MSPQTIARLSTAFLGHLLEPALRSLLLGSLAAVLLYLLRVKSPVARLAVWTGVLYAALAMPLLSGALPALSIPLPSFLAPPSARSAPRPFVVVRASTVAAALAPAARSNPALQEHPNRASEAKMPGMWVPLPSRRARTPRAATASPGVFPANRQPIVSSPAAPAAATAAKFSAPSREALSAVAAAIAFTVAFVMLGRIGLGILLAGRLLRSSDAIADRDALRVLLWQARAQAVSTPPRLAESDLISVPATLGVLRPVILLPSGWRNWDEVTLSAVMAHEMSHIARRDALTQRLALLHRALFWFSPLAWWLNRALADAAEEASDEAALLAGTDRAFYARTLLGFFAALAENPRRVYWQGVSMAAPGQAERRVDHILNWKGAVSMRIRKSLFAGLAIAGLPVVLLAAAARPSASPRQAAPAPVQIPAPVAPLPRALYSPAAPAAPLPTLMPMAAQAPAAAMPAVPPETPQPVIIPAAPAWTAVQGQRAQAGTYDPNGPTVYLADAQAQIEAQNQAIEEARLQLALESGSLQPEEQAAITAQLKAMENARKQLALEAGRLQAEAQGPVVQVRKGTPTQIEIKAPFLYDGKEFTFRVNADASRYVIVSSNSPMFMSGDSTDLQHATGLRSKISGDFIWFQHDEKSYVIRDQSIVNQAKAIFKPQQDLGDQQAGLGQQQQALGDQQRDLGKKMEDTKVTVPDMTADLQKLEAQMKQLSAGGTQKDLGDLQRQLGDLQRRLGESQRQAGGEQSQIGEQMRQLGEKQRELGFQQRDLGQKQRDASMEANRQMKQLLDDAVSKGTAQPE